MRRVFKRILDPKTELCYSTDMDKDQAQGVIKLDFSPFSAWPENLPSFCWGRLQLTGFQNEEAPLIDLQKLNEDENDDFLSVFKSIYPKLSFIEVANFYNRYNAQDEVSNIQWKDFFYSYSFHLNESLLASISIIENLPAQYLKWAHSKSLSAKDFSIFKSFEDIQPIHDLLESVAQLNPSKSIGVKITELIGELYLLKTDIETLKPLDKETPEKFYKRLYSYRYKSSEQRDTKCEKILKTLPWPALTKPSWQRQGDKTGIEVKFFANSHEDFEKKVNGLFHVSKVLKKSADDLWE